MKKRLMAFITMVLTISCLAVPAFAAETIKINGYPNSIVGQDEVTAEFQISISNVVRTDNNIHESLGEVYVCQAPVEVTALDKLWGFGVSTFVPMMDTYIEGQYLVADGFTEENWFTEEPREAGTKFTLTEPGLYYAYGNYGALEGGVNVVILVEGNQENSSEKTINLWSDKVPNGTVTINGLKDTTSIDGVSDTVYIIDKNSTITYNRALASLEVYDEKDIALTNPLSDVFTSDLVKGSRQDNEFWYDEDSDVITIEYIKPNASLSFTKEGVYGIYTQLGYETKEERIAVQSDESYSWQYSPTLYVKVIDSSADSNNTATPETNTAVAVPTTSKVIVDGVTMDFDAYTIDGNNYFKLRDVAVVVGDSVRQFEVTWNDDKNAIELISGQPYTKVGGELAKGDGTSKTATANTSAIYKDGVAVELTAYTINGNNYFKLRDLGQTFDFDVSWDGTNNAVIINPHTPYTAD